MAQTYRLTGSQDPASRIDRVLVEAPTEESPEGKVLELDGPAVELSDDQYSKLAAYVRLEPVKAQEEPEPQIVDQPGVGISSRSTAVPPETGTTPDVDKLSKDELMHELERVRAQDSDALQDVSEKSNKEDLRKALRDYHGQGA